MLPSIYKTERFTLKPYETQDEKRFIEMTQDKLTKQFMGDTSTSANSEKELFQKIFDVYNNEEKPWFWVWGIYEENLLVGHLELKESEHTSADELEIVYMVHPAERNRAVMKEVLNYIKRNKKLWKRQIIATVDPLNKISISLLNDWGIEKQEAIFDEEENDQYLKLYLK